MVKSVGVGKVCGAIAKAVVPVGTLGNGLIPITAISGEEGSGPGPAHRDAPGRSEPFPRNRGHERVVVRESAARRARWRLMVHIS